MEVKGRGWFSIARGEDLFVEEGWLICIGICQLSEYIRMVGATSVSHFWKREFPIWKGGKLEQLLRSSTGIKGLRENSWFSVGMCAYVDRLI